VVRHFFERYKYLERGKWVKALGWKDVKTTKKLIEEEVMRLTE